MRFMMHTREGGLCLARPDPYHSASDVELQTVAPKFMTRGHLYKAIIGDSIELPCKVKDLGSYVLLWRRGTSVLTAANLMVTRDARFKLIEGYNLQIANVKIQDAGDYICQIGDNESRDQVHTLEILVPPTIRVVPQNRQITARKGSTVTMECKASGNPVPAIYWHKKDSFAGSSHLSESTTMVLERVDRHHAGIYQCTADNGVREAVHADIEVTVLSPPDITVEKTWVHASEGFDIDLMCTVHGDVNSEMLWYQNSFLLDPTDRRSMYSKGDKYTLNIRNFQQSDFGNYSCVADNALGRTKKYIEVSGRPGPANFLSPAYSNYLDRYNLTYTIESIPPLDEIKLLYRKLMTIFQANIPSAESLEKLLVLKSVLEGKKCNRADSAGCYRSFISHNDFPYYSLRNKLFSVGWICWESWELVFGRRVQSGDQGQR
ncbi:hypothetical protein pipiens_002511 [Culex pipiens pipiens]|uniref:Ig-like domain-containing protein n=1 Tax=Culex pipiens pipiens TaxID=38569 RepID=A0ABD1DD85_CULPP